MRNLPGIDGCGSAFQMVIVISTFTWATLENSVLYYEIFSYFSSISCGYLSECYFIGRPTQADNSLSSIYLLCYITNNHNHNESIYHISPWVSKHSPFACRSAQRKKLTAPLVVQKSGRAKLLICQSMRYGILYSHFV